MGEIVTDRSQNILRVELNRPAKKNSMTSRMYVMLADEAAKDDGTRVKEALRAFLEKRPPHFAGVAKSSAVA